MSSAYGRVFYGEYFLHLAGYYMSVLVKKEVKASNHLGQLEEGKTQKLLGVLYSDPVHLRPGKPIQDQSNFFGLETGLHQCRVFFC